MKALHTFTTLLPSLLASIASAQLLTKGNGNLPACAQTCPVLVTAQQQCNGASSPGTDLQAWACFCPAVWAQTGGQLTTMCATTCPSPNDGTAIQTWYTNNCGSDNGASEHGGSNGGTGTNGGASSSSFPSSQPSTTSVGASSASENGSACADWWSCHWKWVVMIIVIAIGLLVLGFGGRWLKKRHDRKRDRMSASFNAGITTNGPQMSRNDANASRAAVPGPEIDAANGRDSPVRTREAFMPYGYGYTRSESRVGGRNDYSSPLARGTTPVNEMEKGAGASSDTPESAPRKKSRRIMVREKSGGSET